MLKSFVLVVSIILASACIQNSPPNLTSESNNQVQPTVGKTVQETAQTPPQNQGELGGISTVPTLQEQQPEAPKEPGIVSFIVAADDNGLYPQTVAVPKDAIVNITFKVRTQNVYYGGLDFRSSKFTTGTVLPGKEITVQFTADTSFRYTSYWPASNRKKADGDIIIK